MASPARTYQQISDEEVIFRVGSGRTVPSGYPAEGQSINHLNDADLALRDLRVYVAPPPPPPTLEDYQAQKLSEVRFEAGTHIQNTYPAFYQRNVGLGVYVDDLMATEIASVITESNRVEDLIDDATDLAGVDAAVASISWPVLGGS